MIHTVYSNSYEVLKAVLMHNIENLRFVDSAVSDENLLSRAFERVPVVIPSVAVEKDLKRSIARRDGICAGIDCMTLGAWMNHFSRDVTNLIGPEAVWMIWQALCEKGEGSFRENYPRLRHYLEGKDEVQVYRLATHVAEKFMTYASYRFDWILEWLGVHTEMLPRGREHEAERRRLESHPDFHWQRALWRRLFESPQWSGTGFIRDFPAVLKQFAETGDVTPFEREEGDVSVALPDNLHLFVPVVVPPLMLPILKAFAKPGREVWLYLLNPTDRYWYDLIPRSLMNWGAGSVSGDNVHPILADNGRSTRANLDRLWRFTQGPETAGEEEAEASLLSELDAPAYAPDLTPAPIRRTVCADWEAYAGRHQDLRIETDVDVQNYFLEAGDERLLRRIQDSILDLNPDLKDGDPHRSVFRREDESVLFVRAPTATRELENLADWLQSLFVKDSSLRPDDVLVVMPDISGAAPLIDKVFGSLPSSRRIPWTVSGARPSDSAPAASAVMGLLGLLAGRADLLGFIEWVSLPVVSEKYGFSVSDMAVLNDWLAQAGYRFGFSDRHLEAIERHDGQPVLPEVMHDMSLERALERLTMGFFMPEEAVEPWGDTLPVRGNEGGWVSVGDRPLLLEGLLQVAGKLECARLQTEEAKTPDEWQRWFGAMLADFFPAGAGDDGFETIRRAVSMLAEEMNLAARSPAEVERVSYALFVEALIGKLQTSPVSAYGGNAVTFSGMTEMRNLPYRVIAVLGLNADSAFPGSSSREEFDLMAVHPRRGDRDSRIDNRNVFLDLLLAARDCLMISFVTGTGTDRDERQPSIVAQELLAWLLDFAGGVPEGEPGYDRRSLTAHLVRKVPLTGYSPENFRPDVRGWSGTDAGLFEALARAKETQYAASLPPFAEHCGKDVLAGRTEIPFEELWRFWKSPSSVLLRHFNIRLPEKVEDRRIDIRPPSGGLAAWLRRREAWTVLGENGDMAALIGKWSADPSLGAVGVRDWAGLNDLEMIRAVREHFEEVPGKFAMTQLPDETYRYRMPGGPAVRLTSRDLYRMPAKKSKQKGLSAEATDRVVMLRHLYKKPDGRSAAQFFFEYLFYVGAHPEEAVELHLVFYDDKAKCWPVFGYAKPEADLMLSALIGTYVGLREDIVRMPETTGPSGIAGGYTPDLRADSLVLRGRDLHTLWQRRAALQEALGQMKAQRSRPEPASVARGFVEAMTALREAAAVSNATGNEQANNQQEEAND